MSITQNVLRMIDIHLNIRRRQKASIIKIGQNAY